MNESKHARFHHAGHEDTEPVDERKFGEPLVEIGNWTSEGRFSSREMLGAGEYLSAQADPFTGVKEEEKVALLRSE
jgi:hypothetical protein